MITFVEKSGCELAEAGMKQADKHAKKVNPCWREGAYEFIKEYCESHDEPFTAEVVRYSAELAGFPVPPSLRAWGLIMIVAAKRGWIQQIGYRKVQNPKAHSANAALWQSKIFKEYVD